MSQYLNEYLDAYQSLGTISGTLVVEPSGTTEISGTLVVTNPAPAGSFTLGGVVTVVPPGAFTLSGSVTITSAVVAGGVWSRRTAGLWHDGTLYYRRNGQWFDTETGEVDDSTGTPPVSSDPPEYGADPYGTGTYGR